jgi:hypothetical protein
MIMHTFSIYVEQNVSKISQINIYFYTMDCSSKLDT